MGYQASPRRFIAVLALTAISSASAGAYVFALRGTANALLGVHDGTATLSSVLRAGLPLLAVAGVQQIATILLDVQRTYLGTLVSKRGEERVLAASCAADLIAFESPEFANRLVVAQQGAARAFPTVTTAVGMLGSLISLVTLSVALITVMPALFGFALLAAVPTWTVTIGFARAHFRLFTSQVLFTRQRDYLSRVLTGRHEAKEIRAFGLAEHLRSRWEGLYAETLGAQYAQAVRQAWTLLCLRLLEGVIIGAGGLLLLVMMLHGKITVAAATACAYGFQRLRAQSKVLHSGNTALYENGLYLREWDELQQPIVPTVRAGRPRLSARPFTHVEVENVTFTYPGADRPALSDITLSLRAGEIVALVGENGSGKTTLAKLLAHLYRPSQGSICWDGIDTEFLEPNSVREHVAVIFQDFVHWELSARDNITMGRLSRLEDSVWLREATHAAGADPLINRLPAGFDTILSKTLAEGVDLSGGEWQALALARAYYRDAPFVVLDEPTAALDPKAEAALFARIRDLYAGRTVLLVTHRFATVRTADRILVLEHGRITEQGTHDTLMARGGMYGEMFTTQAGGYLNHTPVTQTPVQQTPLRSV